MAHLDALFQQSAQMTFGEQVAIEGVLARLRPSVSIELGTAEGGSLSRIARWSTEVHTFDFVTLAKVGRAAMLVLNGEEDRLAVRRKVTDDPAEGERQVRLFSPGVNRAAR